MLMCLPYRVQSLWFPFVLTSLLFWASLYNREKWRSHCSLNTYTHELNFQYLCLASTNPHTLNNPICSYLKPMRPLQSYTPQPTQTLNSATQPPMHLHTPTHTQTQAPHDSNSLSPSQHFWLEYLYFTYSNFIFSYINENKNNLPTLQEC